MTPQQKALKLAEFWAQIAAGRIAQIRETSQTDEWRDITVDNFAGPDLRSNLDTWRIKQELNKMWKCVSPDKETIYITNDKNQAALWESMSYTVTEWQEVV
jgi:hypothetical protein